MTKIYIEDNELDISKDFSQQLTFAIDDLINLDSKATSFSKTIILPGTARNNFIFGNIFEFANSNFTNDADVNVFYNFNASKSAKARMEINGLQAMKGVLRLLSIIRDGKNVEYEVALFGELGGFVTKLANKRLTDLDFSEYNHQYNITNITDSWNFEGSYHITSTSYFYAIGGFGRFPAKVVIPGRLPLFKAGDKIIISGTASNDGTYTINSIIYDFATNLTTISILLFNFTAGSDNDFYIDLAGKTKGVGYVYPLINYGNVSYNIPSTNPSTAIKYKDWQYQAFRPALFVRQYMDKIITDAGYTWESDFFDTDFFKRLIVPNNDVQFFNRSATKFVENSSATALTKTSTNNLTSGNQLFGGLSLTNFTYSSGVLTYTGTEILNVKIKANFFYIFSRYRVGSAKVSILKNNNEIGLFNLALTNDYISGSIEAITQINPNDTISLTLFVSTGSIRLGYTASATINADTKITIEPDPPAYIPYTYGNNINVNHTIPANIFQKDFFTSIMKMFNLMVTEDKYKEKHLIITPNVDYYQLANYEDWTYKINRAKSIVLKPMSEVNSRYYKFNFKQDSDYYAEEYRKKYVESYGNRIYDNQLEFAKDEKSLDVIFSSSILTGYQNEDKVFSAIYKLNNNLEERMTSNIRIMQVKLIEGVTSYKILNGSTTLDTRTDYMYAGHLDDPDNPQSDLNFGATKELYFTLLQGSLQNNLFNAFYSSYMAEITDKDSRLLTAEVKLNEKDIFNLDFSRFKMIDGVLYRLMKVNDWSANELCKAEFLRVINTTYQSNYYIGQEFGGGKIFYIDESGQHGLIAPLEIDLDLTTYSFASSTAVWNTINGIGTGLSNTEIIISGDPNPIGKIPYLAYNSNIKGYSDWFLPSQDELQALVNSNVYDNATIFDPNQFVVSYSPYPSGSGYANVYKYNAVWCENCYFVTDSGEYTYIPIRKF